MRAVGEGPGFVHEEFEGQGALLDSEAVLSGCGNSGASRVAHVGRGNWLIWLGFYQQRSRPHRRYPQQAFIVATDRGIFYKIAAGRARQDK